MESCGIIVDFRHASTKKTRRQKQLTFVK